MSYLVNESLGLERMVWMSCLDFASVVVAIATLCMTWGATRGSLVYTNFVGQRERAQTSYKLTKVNFLLEEEEEEERGNEQEQQRAEGEYLVCIFCLYILMLEMNQNVL